MRHDRHFWRHSSCPYPGQDTPEEGGLLLLFLREKLGTLGKDAAPTYGGKATQNLLVQAKPLVNGAYLILPASMPHLAGDVIQAIT